jgi:integrase
MKLKYVELRTVRESHTIENVVVNDHSYALFQIDNNEDIAEFKAYEDDLNNSDRSANTINTYRQAVLKFIDYLYAANVMGTKSKASLHYVNKIVLSYRDYLVNKPKNEEAKVIIDHMKDYKPNLNNNSANIHLIAIESYLLSSEKKASAIHTQMCRAAGLSPSAKSYQPLFNGIWESKALSYSAKLKWQNNTMIGGVVGAHNHRGINSRVFKRFKTEDANIRSIVKISQNQISKLLSWHKLSLRDKLLFSFLHASGMRISECLLLQFRHIDFIEQRVFMSRNIDSAGLSMQELKLCKHWKGRDTVNNEVFLFGEAENIFWLTLNEYLKSDEFVSDHSHSFLFVFSKGVRKGRPLLLVNKADINARSVSNIEKKYKEAQSFASVSKLYGFHLARHALVNYLYYEIPRIVDMPDGSIQLEIGLLPQTVRALIGHESINSTMKYSRDNAEKARAEFSAAREKINSNFPEEITILIDQKHKAMQTAISLDQKIKTILNKGISSNV